MLGVESHNLDLYLSAKNTVRELYAHYAAGHGAVVVPDETSSGGAGGGSRGPVFGGTYSPSGPVIPTAPPPPHNVGNVGISIIVGGNTYDAGDQYGCCTGTSDGYM